MNGLSALTISDGRISAKSMAPVDIVVQIRVVSECISSCVLLD